jgi:tetratricopeptide (TPR) repeat protein
VGDVLALQTDVAKSVAAALRANLQNDVADVAARRVNAKAYHLYLRGQQQLRTNLFEEAERYFEQAIATDPEFIPGYYGLGAAYVWQVIDVRVAVEENREKLREILRRALTLAPDDSGLLALSGQLARYDGDVQLAEQRFAAALQKDPANSTVRYLYGMFKLDQSNPAEALRVCHRSLETDPMNPLIYVGTWASNMDLWDAEQALAAASHYRELATSSDFDGDNMIGITKLLLSGDIAGSISDVRIPTLLTLLHYFIGDLQTAEALMERARRTSRNRSGMFAVEVYRHLVYGDVDEARSQAVAALSEPKVWGGHDDDFIVVRLASEAMIERGKAQRAVDFFERLAPEYARYKATKNLDPKNFSPAPIPVKSAFSSFPALYFADYVRALRAVGDEAGANQMLDHLEAILALRRTRGLFIEERHAAEALALRGQTEAALDALEKAERDRTIYHRWHLVLLHNETFAGFRNHPRFVALVEKIRRDLSRQREQLESAKN